ncbi:cytochrome p450 monooxygenase [Rhodococcus rhodochrous]|uniref:cytochrome P450/oxidoreductase n=1 Tax=Rhodococcus rhodochrous TaxID=1829 RepID=UPI0007513AE8|nr:cytochrome P450 [Rhodococcus rhodochrous]MDO1485118.1 cytochrome P450 [Rhodococcus rhodochrous]SNV09978.1 cytochrome p450 monooxygenase [Rhodococcus rhodochrous]
MARSGPVIDFDHHRPEFRDDAPGVYASVRETCPVAWTESHGGFWVTTRYSDIVRIARDDTTFSSSRGETPELGTAIVVPRGPGLVQYPIELDPPEATVYRDLVNPLLSREAVERLRPMIDRHTHAVIDDFVEEGVVDFVRQLTNPLPTAVTLDWLGFPREDWKRLAGPVHDIFAAAPGSDRAVRGGKALGWMETRIRSLLAERRIEARDDALSHLVAATRPDGTPFSDDELVSVAFLLIAGGVDTTTSLTGSTLVYLSAHPEDRERLRADPALLDVATEEFLRVFSPSQSMARTVTTDTEVGGCPMSRGERVLIPWVAGNFDPEVFPEPDRVILDRAPRGHLSFGTGSHRCAGAHLARAMFHSMITAVLTRLPDFRVDAAAATRYESCGSQAGWDSIPATFMPGTRLSGTAPAPGTTPERVDVVVAERRMWANDVVALDLTPVDGVLPPWLPGAHVAVTLPSGRVRQYSLCSAPADGSRYTIAVRRQPDGRGGSSELHDEVRPGDTLSLSAPRNRFALVPAPWRTFVAGGIGITPIVTMVRELIAAGDTRWDFVYCGRTRDGMPLLDEVTALGSFGRVRVHVDEEDGILDLTGWARGLQPGAAVFCCGPESLMNGVAQVLAPSGHPLHVERFGAGDSVDPLGPDPQPFEVVLARSGRSLTVPATRTALDVVRECVPTVSSDCEEGYCGSCEVRVLEGTPLHRDSVLTDAERDSSKTMMLCVSRCAGEKLVLDL